MAILKPHTLITVVVSGAAGSWIPFTTPSPETLKARVTTTLQGLGYGVPKFDLSHSSVVDDILALRGSYPYVGEIVVENKVYEDSALTVSTIRSAFETAAGEAPSAVALTNIGGVATGTPAPKKTDPTAGGFFDELAKMFAGLGDTVKWIAIAIVVVVVGVLVVLPQFKATA